MSIWVPFSTIGFDPHGDTNDGQVRSYAGGWSNHYPSTDGSAEREAAIDLADIPAWCAGGDDDDFTSVGAWLRLSVRSYEHDYTNPSETVGEAHATVVLDEDAARTLHQQLTEWLQRPKVRPGMEEGTHGQR